MPELYIIGLGKGGADSLKILEDPGFPGVDTCIIHSAPPYLRELAENMGLHLINCVEAIKPSPGDLLRNLYRETAKFVQGVLEKEKAAFFFLPGRPWSGEAIAAMLSSQLRGVRVSMHPAAGDHANLWEQIMDFLGEGMAVDFSRGISFYDAHFLEEIKDPPRSQLLIAHPCSTYLLSNIKKTLSAFYPPEHDVNILQFDSKGSLSLLKSQPLGRIEETGAFNCWTFFHLAPTSYYTLGDMAFLMEQLRSPEGCPWDRQQDHLSLRPYVLEEAYEVVEAIDRGIPHELCEELGDLLLQVVFHSRLAGEKGDFSLWQVIDGLTRKIYRRHPHVFQDEKVTDAKGVRLKWQEIKQQEKGREKTGIFAVPAGLPALMKAQKIQKRAADVGFDWPDISGAVEKVHEEIKEFREAYAAGHGQKTEEELGDVFFALVNMARFLGVDAEIALHFTIEKFLRRFKYIEGQVELRGGDYSAFTLEELDGWWREAKEQEKK